MSTSLGRGRGARVKLDSKVGRVGTTTTMTTTTAMKKLNPGVTHPTPAPSQVVFPSSQGSDLSLPLTVIQALKSGCVTIEKLLELSSFLLSHGSALEETHSDVLADLIRCLRSYVHSSNIPAARVRSTRLAIIRLLEIRQQGWVTAPSADAFYKQHIAQLAETSEISISSGVTAIVTPRDQDSRPSSSLSNHESAKKPPQDEAWESLGVESLSVRDDVQAEESAFIEANNATGTPAVQQFNCIPQSLQGADSPIVAVAEADPVNGPGLVEQSNALPHLADQEAGRSSDSTETPSGDVGLGPLSPAPPMTISTANLHSRYLTNQKGQMLIISACSPLIVGMAENILLRQIPTLQSMPTTLEMVTKPKSFMKDNSAQCDLLHDKSFGSFGTTTSTVSPAAPVNLSYSASSVTSAPSAPSAPAATVDLFVRHLHESVDDRALFGAFEPFDDLVNARVQTDDDGYSKGYGFVSFASLEAANVAVAAMNGAELRTKRLFVDLAKRKDDVKQTERDFDDHQNKPVYSHFSKPAYQRSKSEVPSSGRSANRQIDDPLFDDTDICGVEEFGAVDSGTPATARPAREAPLRDTGGVKWHVTGKSRGVAPPMARDSQERAPSSMRVSHDPRGRYCDEDEDEAATEEDSGRSSRSPDSPRVPVVIGPWLKMAVDFADRKDANGDLDDFVGDAQPMEKLLRDIPSTGETDRYRQFLLSLSLSPLSQEPPLENWEIYCREQNDCCVECMSEAFNPIRYLDYWERTSPQERCSRRPTYEEHDNRKAVYEEHDHRKVDYAKIYGPPKAPIHRQRSNPERPLESVSGAAPRAQHSPADEETPPYSYNKAPPGDTSDLTLVTTLESMNETSIRSKSPRVSVPPGFENQSQSTILCEDQLTALMMSTDFDDDFDRNGGGDTLRKKVLSSTADDNLLVNVSAVTEEMKKFDFSQS